VGDDADIADFVECVCSWHRFMISSNLIVQSADPQGKA
jgi:hypothetical protein